MSEYAVMTLTELRPVLTSLQNMFMQAVRNNEHEKLGAISEQINKVIEAIGKQATARHV